VLGCIGLEGRNGYSHAPEASPTFRVLVNRSLLYLGHVRRGLTGVFNDLELSALLVSLPRYISFSSLLSNSAACH
jgi:hypothetical protein